MSHQKEAAQTLGALGFRVHPLHTPIFTDDGITRCSCGRSECYVRADGTGGEYAASVGKHPRLKDWWSNASASASKIDEWWGEYPDANIGIACGLPDGVSQGVVVIDVDPRNGGTETLERLIEELGPLPQTAQAISGGGGPHFYFITTEQFPSGKLGQGVDFQARGNQVVAPPSVHKSGRRYAWELSSDPTEGAKIAVLPAAWAARVRTSKQQAPSVATPEPGAPIVEGNGGKDGPGRKQTLISRGRTMLAKNFSPSEIRAALAAMNEERCVPPLDVLDFERIVDFVLRKPAGPSEEFASEELEAKTPANDDSLLDLWGYYSDASRAEQFAENNCDRLRFCEERGWFSYDAGVWRVDNLAAERFATIDAKRIAIEAGDDKKRLGEDTKKRKSTVSNVLSRRAITAVVDLSRHHLAARLAQFDADPWAFNCANGTIDLRTGTLQPHLAENLCSKQSPVVFDSTAEMPMWNAFLEKVLPDAAVRNFVQRFTGYALTGVVREHVYPIFYGPGGNGKGVFLTAVAYALGDYGRTIPQDLLVQRDKEEHKTELAQLLGIRLAVAQETAQGKRLDENKTKALTGGDRISARFLFKDFFEFAPTHKLLLATNYKPVVRGTDAGIWRRLLLVPWLVTIPREKQDTALGEKLRAEAPGILRWCVEGCMQWQSDGLQIPDAIRAATEEYKTDSDTLGRFLEERVEHHRNAKLQSRVLHEAYTTWCKAEGEFPMSSKALTTELVARYGWDRPKKLGDGCNYFHGIRLQSSESSGILRSEPRSDDAVPEDTEDPDDSSESSQSEHPPSAHEQLKGEPSEPSGSSVPPARVRGVA